MQTEPISFPHKKIAIIGCGGSGKTTLAKNLSHFLHLPVYHLDQYYWKPGWIESDLASFKKAHEQLCAQERWIIDGNQMSTIADRINKADVIIFLNMPTSRCIWRIITRWLRFRKKQRNDIPEGCFDRITYGFFKYVWNFNRMYQPRILTMLAQASSTKQIYILNSPQQVALFTNKLKQKLEDKSAHA